MSTKKIWPKNFSMGGIIGLFWALLLIGCSPFSKYKYVNYKKLNSPNKRQALVSKILIPKDKLNWVWDLKIIMNHVVLIDYKSENMIRIFGLDGKSLTSFGKKGQGPSEFISPTLLIPDPKQPEAFWIYDIEPKILKKFNIKKILEGNYSPEEIIKLKEGAPFRLTITPNYGILAVGLFPEGRIIVYNFKGNIVRRIGEIPVKSVIKKFPLAHSQGFSGPIIYCNTNEAFVATKYGSIVEKYNLKEGKLIATYYGPNELFFPEYDIVWTGEHYVIVHNKKTRWGYVDMACAEKTGKIFLLYSGNFSLDKKGRRIGGAYTNTIYVMNKEGELTEELVLDKKIHRLTVSRDGTSIYGIAHGEILKFNYKMESSQ